LEYKVPLKTALATFTAFFLMGFIPLISFIMAHLTQIPNLVENQFTYSFLFTGLAFIMIGVPVSVWLSSLLLETFAYRISIGLNVVVPGVITVHLVSALTIVVQTIRSTRVRLVEVLRYE